jgi:hypothetical protein
MMVHSRLRQKPVDRNQGKRIIKLKNCMMVFFEPKKKMKIFSAGKGMNGIEALSDALSNIAEQLGLFSRAAKIRDVAQLKSLSNQFRLRGFPEVQFIKNLSDTVSADTTWHNGQS